MQTRFKKINMRTDSSQNSHISATNIKIGSEKIVRNVQKSIT